MVQQVPLFWSDTESKFAVLSQNMFYFFKELWKSDFE